MQSGEIRKKFLDFFEKRGHTIVPSSSLIPDDPSVLLTTAGMQQFKPYYSELDPEKTIHPSIGKPVGKNAVSIQKCFRTSDIDEVGDESHLTFFEMLGNFSFGGYFKEKAIEYGHEFIAGKDWMNLEIDYVTVFDPAKVPAEDWRACVPFDKESYEIWKKIGIPEEKIVREGIDNFWGPTGSEGPCGPTTEIYVKTAAGKSVEIWNIVFNEFYGVEKNDWWTKFKNEIRSLLKMMEGRGHSSLKLTKLKTPGVDTGMGLERLAMVSQNVSTIFETDLFSPIIIMLPVLSNRFARTTTDHIRGSVFLIADGVKPNNKETGYVLRRLLRKLFFYEKYYGLQNLNDIVLKILEIYKEYYPELAFKTKIFKEIDEERIKFSKTLDGGIKEAAKLYKIDSKIAFNLYETYGLPFEVIKELADHKNFNLNREDFDKEFANHQEISRAGAEKKFGGHGLMLDTGELKAADEKELKIVTLLHTATHMLQAALRQVLGINVKQAGSDITVERTRFDFTFDRKLTPEEIKKVEDVVNEKIKEDLPMQKIVLPKSEAEKTGALYFFKEKYPDPVNVYFIGKSLETAWSKEFCGGPHVTRTGEIGAFKIIKEEAVGAGVRRIRGVLL